MAITAITITTPEIDKTEFKDLTVDILEDLVHGDTAPFKDVKSVLEDYLDGATDLDPTQKAGIFADWLKDAYSQVNQQAMTTAFQILDTNARYELEAKNTESSYNQGLANIQKSESDNSLVSAQITTEGKQQNVLDENIEASKWSKLEQQAKIRKQFGFAVPDNTDLGADNANGAIDKQIDGYKLLHLKDQLKTMDERVALMQNAKIPESTQTKNYRTALINQIKNVATGQTVTTLPDMVVPTSGS